MDRHLIEGAKQHLTIGEIWRRLDLPGRPPPRVNGCCHSPFRDDRTPSFSIFANGARFKDHATGDSGDAVHFLALATGLRGRALFETFVDLAFGQQVRTPEIRRLPPKRWSRNELHSHRPGFDLRSTRPLTVSEIRAVASLRRVSEVSVALLAELGCLRIGFVKGFVCWIVMEPDGSVATARRLDGRPFTKDGRAYKSHALTPKRLPLGLSMVPAEPRKDRAVLLCEGEGDFLAAFHFLTLWGEPNLHPVAMLGRTTDLAPVAAERLAGWRIRAFPHADEDGRGFAAVARWAASIPGASADAFRFTDPPLRLRSGGIANDLNDCTALCEADAHAMAEANPLPQRDPTTDRIRRDFDLRNARRWHRSASEDFSPRSNVRRAFP